jgi:DNA transposition AAA+ family ATPase
LNAIRKFRKGSAEPDSIPANKFVHNRFTRLIFGGLSFALKNHSITMIIGEARRCKTWGGRRWCQENNHGKSVFVTAPVSGGVRAFVLRVARAVGVGTSGKSTFEIWEECFKAFNKDRILVVDEAHRLALCVRALEMVRDLHDATGCAVGFLSTERFSTELNRCSYMFEQLLGRILLPVRLPKKVLMKDIEGIVQNYVKRPTKAGMDEALAIANAPGSFGILVAILDIGALIASKAGRPMSEADFFRAIEIRAEMMHAANEDPEKE